MSQEIVCKECAFSNPAGSKFCNNCGTKLPLGTHIICINCGTSNPIDRVFCDHCGTRLIPEEPRPEAKAKDEPAAPVKGAFSLPARRPGETGDLDPSKVPDWLKTGKMGREPDSDDLAELDLPRIEELTRKRHTDDLPDWLVNEEDSDPIIHAPTIISTEFYKDLLGRAEAAPRPPDDLFSEDEADLPDWLMDAGPSAGKTEPPPAKSAGVEDEGIVGTEKPAKAARPLPPQPPETEKSLTSWLSSAQLEEEDDWNLPQQPADSLTSWLSQEGDSTVAPGKEEQESLTSWLADTPIESDDEWASASESDAPDLTEWLAAQGTPSSVSPMAADELQDNLTDWLSDFRDEKEEATPVEDEESAAEAGRLTDWFAEASAEPETEAVDAGQFQEDLTDWLTDFPETDFPEEDEIWDESSAGPSETGRLAAWFSEPVAAPADKPAVEPVAEISAPLEDSSTDWFDDWADEEETAVTPPDSQADLGFMDWFAEAPETEEPPQAKPQPDEAARLAAWFSETVPPADEETEQFGWLDEAAPPEQAAISPEIPSDFGWLEETEEELASIFQSQPDIAEELPDWLAGVAASADLAAPVGDELESDSLDDIFKTESLAAATEINFLRQSGSLHLDDEAMEKLLSDVSETDDLFTDGILSDEPDWLAALAAMGPEDLRLPEMGETGTPELSIDEVAVPFTPIADFAEEFADETAVLPDVARFTDEDWAAESSFDIEEPEGELPAWISQLDATTSLPEMVDEEGELIPSDELPDWIANMRPGQAMTESVLASVWRDKTPETLAGVPEELAGADLPDWLQDISHDAGDAPSIAMPSDTQLADIPDWLQPGLTLETADADFLADPHAGTTGMTGVGDEWNAILDDLPPAVPLQDLLPKADIPAWVMELKPVELTGESPKVEATGPEESFGPLSGLRGVVAVEPVIALPRVADPLEQFGVSPEQVQQANLLRQLGQDGQGAETTTTRQTARDISGWIRPLLVVVLLLVVILGLRGEIPVIPAQLQPSAALTGVNTAVSQAAGGTVLVAFEYTPAMAGELTPEAETLLMQLADAQTRVLTLSQYTPGVQLAAEVTGQIGMDTAVPLGYLPGGAIGLRRLGECLNQSANCDALLGAPLSASQRQALADVSLIIVLTADRQTLVNWVEQVGAPAERPMIAGVTQALTPLALPYFDTAQLAGVVNGIPGTAVYQQTYYRNAQLTDARTLFNAQVAAQLLAVVVLLLGALIYLITGITAQRRTRQ